MQPSLPLEALLRQKRVASGYNITELAGQAGISRRSLTRWESGDARPRLEELQRLLVVLNLSAPERELLLNKLGTPAAVKELARQEQQKLPMPIPHKGDLLRALRVRQRKSQEEVAAALRVSQATLARWENGKVWPNEETLLRLCFFLEARKDEVDALIRGPFFLSDRDSEGRTVTIEVIRERLRAITTQLQEARFHGLGDLLFLSLEAQTLPLLRQTPEARILLAQILLRHASYLSQRCFPPEAGRVAAQALSLLPRTGERWNPLRMEGELYIAVWRYPMREHAQELRHWLNHPLDLRSRTWIMAQITGSLLEQNKIEEALQLEAEAKTLTLQHGDPFLIQRQNNWYAETLLEIGRPEEALAHMQLMETMVPPIRLRTKLTLSEAYLASGNRPEAHRWFLNALTDNAVLRLSYYQPQIDSLARRI